MKPGLVLAGPDVLVGPLALLKGTFMERLSKASEMGYMGIELMVRQPDQLDWASLKKSIAEAKLELSQIVTGELWGADGLCLVTSDKELAGRAFERIYQVIDMAAYMGTMVNIGRLRGQLKFLKNVNEPWFYAVEALHRVIKYAYDRGVKITIEPLNRYESDYVNNTSEGLKLISDINLPNAGLLLDLFHMNIEDPVIEDSLRLADKNLWHLHIADTNRLYPGSGHMDFETIFSTLTQINYQGYISAELFPVPDGDTAAVKTIEYIGKLLK